MVAQSAPAPASEELEAFAGAFDHLVRAVRRVRSAAAGPEDLTASQFALLAPLLEGDSPPSLRELAAAAGVAPPTATRMLDGLEARGLVTRERCARDRRAVRLALTGAGEDLVRRRAEATHAMRRTMFEALDAGERRAAAQLLTRLAEALEGGDER